MKTARKMFNGEDENIVKFKFYSWSDYGEHKPYGEFKTTLRRLKNGEVEYSLYTIDSTIIIPKARFVFEKLIIEERPSFYDFLHSGWQINLTVAVDFTASNGPVTYPDSLHYINQNGNLNQYEAALMTVGGILMNYDSDQLIPAFGFGGVPLYTQTNQVSHCFHLNGTEKPECMGIQGLMDAYKYSLFNVKLYGPTFFAPTLQVFSQFVMDNISNPLYHILLILTDGEIHDMADTKNLIVAASRLPVSIIIVGVGDEEFKEMVELDSDEKILIDEAGNKASRDIVQFVKYNDFAQLGYQALAEEVLREVPEQITQFLMINGIKL